MFSRLSFWYGLDYFTLRKMPLSAISHYNNLLSKRQAEMRMMQGEAATVPHMDEEQHKEWADSIRQYFDEKQKTEVAAPRKLMKAGIKPMFIRGNDG